MLKRKDPHYLQYIADMLRDFRWHPAANPPESSNEVLVTVHVSDHEFVDLGYYKKDKWFMSDGRDLGGHIVSWMPKPDPAFFLEDIKNLNLYTI